MRPALLALSVLLLAGLAAWLLLRDRDAEVAPPGPAPVKACPAKVDDAHPSLVGAPKVEGTPVPAPPADQPTPVPASADAPARVLVTVLGPLKKPIEGARVRLFNRESLILAQETSDASGMARFGAVLVPTVRVDAAAPGFVPTSYAEYLFEDLLAGTSRTITVRLEAGATLEGRVVDKATGNHLPGARVRLRGGTLDVWPRAVSDAEGRFRLVDLPMGREFSVWAELEGWSRGDSVIELRPTSPDREPLLLALERAGWLVVHVRRPTGEPVAKAWVLAWQERKPDEPGTGTTCDEPWSARVQEGETDAQGVVRIPGLPFGAPFCVRAHGDGFAWSLTTSGVTASEARPGVELEVRLRAYAKLLLRCRDARGEPIAPSVIELGETTVQPGSSEATIDELEPGPAHVVLRAAGRASVVLDLVLVEGETLEREVRFEDEVAIEGVVVDDQGAPIAEMSVFAGTDAETRRTAATDAKGVFRIVGLAAGEHVLRVAPRDVEREALDPEEPAAATVKAPARGVRLVAARPARVVLRVRMPEGVSTPQEFGYLLREFPEGATISFRRTWGDGSIESVVRAGSWRLAVGAIGFAPIERTFDLAVGQTLDLGTATFDTGVTLEGLVVDAGRKPLAGVNVWTDGEMGERFTTEEDGRFVFRHLPKRAVFLSTTSPDFLYHELEVDLTRAQDAVTIPLRRGGLLRGTVTTAAGPSGAGHPVRVALAEREGRDDTEVWLATEEQGDFRVRRAPGRYVVEVLSSDEELRVLARAEVTLVEGGETPLTLKIP